MSISPNIYVAMFFINVLIIFLGCFMESACIIIIFTPILLPIVKQFGMDPIHFGVVLVFGVCLGLITPPLGETLFIASLISKVRVEAIAKGVLPFLFVSIIVLFIITYIPWIVMVLPDLFLGRFQ